MIDNRQVVVVLTRGVVWFRNWVKENNDPNCRYIHGNSLNSVLGIIPNTIVKLEDWEFIEDSKKINDYLMRRLIIIKPKKKFWGIVLFLILLPFWFLYKKSERKTFEEFKTDLIYLK